ncbi:LANO_0F17040g1_1 [Lachancea nothofagi CBS 11611]|uniref:LANO_0F17040g1_1 n=1 Tax=Lachancea nothofagi CBS 11611 TaxID=1266666 RepID=A0A1G4KD21_9SACH|nr:LANO_0F17040g1_1 [Lachancea nothofagi CBS 11611]
MSDHLFESWNSGNGNGQGSNNMNNTVLNSNDDYTNILSSLANSNSQLLNEGTVNRPDPSLESSQTQNSRVSNDKHPNLDILLQHYQELFSRSSGSNSGSGTINNSNGQSTNNKPGLNSSDTSHTKGPNTNSKALAAQENKSVIAENPCDHCRRRQIKCVIVPDLANCVQCETKGIKCGYSETPLSRPSSDSNTDRLKRNRVDENVNVHELLKRSKVGSNDSVSQYYSDLLQNLNQPSSNGKKAFENGQASNLNNLSSPYMMFETPGQNDPGKSAANSIQNGTSPSNMSGTTNYNTGAQKMSYVQQPIQYPRSSFYVGPTSVFDINLVNHVKLDKIDQVQLSKTLALRKVAPNVQFLLRDDLNQKLYMKQEQEVDMVEKLVHPHGKILVDIFFKLIHPQFPILHERVFLEKYSRSYRELTAPLLAALYSLSLQWWDFHPQLVGFPKPDVVDQLNEIALRTFFDVIERPKLSIIQTGLLILQCRSEISSNWAVCSEVVALAEDLGLGVDCQDWRLPRWERGLRRRLAWAVWLQDKWTSMMEARHSHLILGRNWLVKMLTDEDFPGSSPVISNSAEGSQFNGLMHKDVMSPVGDRSMLDLSPTEEDFKNSKLMFQHMISLSIILGEVLDTFYTLGALKTVTKIEHVLKLAKPLQLKMREWYHSLPSQLSMSSFQERKFNSNASLTLSYFAVELTLHRKIIVTLNNESPPELLQVCRLAAKTRLVAAIEFIRDLKFEHVNSFWYTCSTGNLTLIGTFAALLFVTAPSKEESRIYRDCLRNYVWILRMSSKSFEKAGNGLKKIHMLLAQIPGLLTDDPVIPQQPQQLVVPPPSLSPLMHSQQMQSATLAPSPYNSQSTVNQMKNLPPEVLHQLVNIQRNMPAVGGSSSPEKQSKSSGASLHEASGNGEGIPEYNRISPAASSYGEKNSPKKAARGRDEGESPSSSGQLNKDAVQSAEKTSRSFKSKVLTPQSVTGRNGKFTASSDDQTQSSINFEHQREDSQVSPNSIEELNGADKVGGNEDVVTQQSPVVSNQNNEQTPVS